MTRQEIDQKLREQTLREAEARMLQLYTSMQRAQQNANNYTQQIQAGQSTVAATGLTFAPSLQVGLSGQTSSWEHQRILLGFKKNNPELAGFVEATAKLLGYEVDVALSPFDAVTFVGRNRKPNFIWRIHSRRWSIDVQWMADHQGGGQEQWVARFAELTDTITAEKAECEKSGKPIPVEPVEPQITSAHGNSIQNAQNLVAYQQANAARVKQAQQAVFAGPFGGSQNFWHGILGG